MELLLQSIMQALTPEMLLFAVGGTALGLVLGALPGLGAAIGVALLMPVTFYLPAAEGQMILLGIYTGAVFGGSWAAILINIPGCPASVMTTLDGYPMARNGQAGRAMGLAATCSFVGGLFGIVALIAISPLLAAFALSFGPPEYAMLALLGLSSMVVISATSRVKGFIGAICGLLLSMVGTDPVVSVSRFTFGSVELMSGIDYVIIIIGLFGISEVFEQALSPESGTVKVLHTNRVLPTLDDLKCVLRNALWPCLIGTSIGTLPGAGGSIASIISYNRAVQASKTPERFGTGIPEGIIACETANNAAIGGAMVPLLTLGIPGSAVTAVLLGAFMMHNIQPGPMLFVEHRDLVYIIFIALLVTNAAMLVLGILGAPYVSKILRLPQSALLPIITVLSFVGAYSLHMSMLEVWIMLAAGLAGLVLRKLDISLGGFVLGLVLGPIFESNLRAGLEMSSSGMWIFVLRPISGFIVVVTLCIILFPTLKQWWQNKTASHLTSR